MRRKKTFFGKAFSDELAKVSSKTKFSGGKSSYEISESFMLGGASNFFQSSPADSYRKLLLPLFFLVIFGIFFLRLFHLQIVEGKNSRELADSNRVQVKVIHAPRGVIYDRNGKILAQDEPGFRYKEATSGGSKTFYISRDDALKLEVSGDPRLKNLEIDNIRNYPFGEKTAHILGYVSEITAEELKDPVYQNDDKSSSIFSSFSLTAPVTSILGQTATPYRGGDRVGRIGIEEIYEKTLRGIDGGEIIEVDAKGEKVRTLRKIDPVPGQNIYLSIDSGLQSIVYDKLAEFAKKANACCGAVIVQDPRNGEVLSLVSYPSFNPKKIDESLSNPNSPFLNRAISGTYPPGSTFKIVSSLAGLNSGKITPETQFEDTGVLTLGPFKFANWYFTEYGRKEEGLVDVKRALKRSNDIFFYRLGQLTGEEIIAQTAKQMGLGNKLGIDLPGEQEGLIPNNQWKKDNFGEVWYPGDTLHMAIGQGFVLTTPLQVSNLSLQIASDGRYYPPHLAKKITSPTGRLVKEFKYENLSASNFKQTDINLVKAGLNEVPKNGGTAWPFFTFPIETAGKTGTAEFGGIINDKGQNVYKTHAWYTSYAPVQNPEISATVLVEAGGEGSTTASPIAKEIYRWYFSPDKTNLIKDTYNVATESARTLGE
jgi:penicillin-binding protein 2